MKLSVAIITYNHERFLGEALESVLAQQVDFDYEVVVAEDCSTDRTRDIILDFYRCYPDRIVPLLRARNLGGIENANDALRTCRGEYIAILEGDDYWTCPDKLQKQVEFLDRHPDCSICCHRVQLRDDEGSRQGEIFPSQQFPSGSYALADILSENFFHSCSAIYRRGCLKVFLPSWAQGIAAGDWVRNVLAATTGEIMLMDEIMAVYRIHPAGMWSAKPRVEQLSESIKLLAALDGHLDYRYSPAISLILEKYNRALARSYFDLAAAERLTGSRGKTMKYLAACVRAAGPRLPGRVIDWATILSYGVFGIRRLPWWRGPENSL